MLAVLRDNDGWETWAWMAAVASGVCALITTSAAVYAVKFARDQILEAKSNKSATFLANLDGRWEGPDMREARAKWLRMRDLVVKEVERKHPGATAEAKTARRGEECSRYLHDLRHDQPEEYNAIISILGFFETVGFSASRGFVTTAEIIDLFGESIVEFDILCWDHIQKRIEESKAATGMPTKLFEHSCRLILETRKVYKPS